MTDAAGNEARQGRPGGRVAGLAAGLWLLFALMVFWGGWLFLQACGLDALGLDYCPGRAGDDALAREAAAGDDLTRQIHRAQMSIAEAPLCAPAAIQPAAPSSPLAPTRTETETVDQTVVERGGHNGRLQFTLQWATPDDLDLNVDCPGGRIDSITGHAGPGICGDGRKDIDANRNLTVNVSATPIENIVWQSDIPTGTYRIEVIEFRGASNLGNTVPFTLRMRWNDQERVCHDTVTDLPQTPKRMKGDRVLGGIEKMMTWTFGEDLPDCAFTSADTIRGTTSK